MLRRISIFWIILGALLFTSAVPLGVIAFRSIQTTSAEVEREQKQQLLNRVNAHADAIDEQFRQFEITTNLSATRLRELMLEVAPELTEAEIDDRLENYRRDQFGIYGLDAYYLERDGKIPDPEQYDVSNVFVNKDTEITPELEQIIAATAELDEMFGAIRSEEFGSQWLYLTTHAPNGMMRLYPWHPNQYGPPENWNVWEPWDILFYTAAEDQGVYVLRRDDDSNTEVVEHIVTDAALTYFRNPGMPACAADSTGSPTCYVDCSDPAAPEHDQYCSGNDETVILNQQSTLTIQVSQTDDVSGVRACADGGVGGDTCYLDCSRDDDGGFAADPILGPYYCVDELATYQGMLLLEPIAGTTTHVTTIEGISRSGMSACNDAVGNNACYLDCTETSHPLHPQYCRRTVWTAPYYDFAGQGLMVTNSLPVYNNSDEIIAVMSHDLRIDVMSEQVLGFQVGDEGFAFLLDTDGQIIAHVDYSPEQFAREAELGAPQFQRLAEEEPDIAPVVQRMTAGEEGVSSYEDKDGEEWIVAYTTIPSTEWHLGLTQPRSEIVAPATKIRTQVLTGAAVMVLAVLGMSILLARGITRPVSKLSATAKEIEASVDTETTEVIGTNLEQLTNLTTAREISNLASVFEQMVLALQQRMVELNSIYAMGQTITANVDYDDTMRAVLNAVRSVVTYDAAEISLLKGNSLVVESWKGEEGFNDTTGRKYRLGRGPTGQIGETKQSVLLSTVSGNEDLQRTLGYSAAGSEFIARTTKIVVNSFLGIPLLIGDRLIGTLTLVHREKGHFKPDDERQLNKLAAQASVAIQNAIQVRERERQLKQQIEDLRVEIDQAKLTRQVEEVTDSDFFRSLQANAARMRQRYADRQGEAEEETDETTDTTDEES